MRSCSQSGVGARCVLTGFLSAALLLAGCNVSTSRFVFDYPGVDQTGAAFRKDRADCRFEAIKAAAGVRRAVDQAFAEARVLRACMAARGYPVTYRLAP